MYTKCYVYKLYNSLSQNLGVFTNKPLLANNRRKIIIKYKYFKHSVCIFVNGKYATENNMETSNNNSKHDSEDLKTSPQNTIGSSNQVKTDSSKPDTTVPKKNLWKTVKTATSVANSSSNSSEPEDPKTTLKSVAKRVNRQIKAMTLIKRWTQMTSHSQFANDKDHLQYMRDSAKDSIVAIPDPLIADIREEVLSILVVGKLINNVKLQLKIFLN